MAKLFLSMEANMLFARSIGLSERSLSLKLNNKVSWKDKEMAKAIDLLGLKEDSIPIYFLIVKFNNFELKGQLMSNIAIEIKDDFINELVQSKVESILENYKRQYASIDIKDLVTITGLSKSTLQNKIVCEPEIVEITRRIGTRVIYLYPQILDAYQKVINRLGS